MSINQSRFLCRKAQLRYSHIFSSFCMLILHYCSLFLTSSRIFTWQIKNNNFFETTEGVEFEWAAHGDGYELGCGILSLPVIEPQSIYVIEWKSGPWYPLWASSDAQEIFLTITAKLLHSKRWVDAGHVVSSSQVQLPAKRDSVPHVSSTVFFFVYSIRCYSESA